MKTLNHLKKTVSVTLLLLIATAFSFTANGQTCNRLLKSKTGKVYSVSPGVVSVVAPDNSITVKIRKTAGRAETQVNFYIDNVQQPSKKIEYDNGPHIPSGWQSRTLTGVKNKTVKVEIVNQSVGNTFSYELKMTGPSKNLTRDNRKYTGTLMGQMNKTMYTKSSCTGKARIIVRRTGGNARATIRVWEKRSNGSWRSLNNFSQTFEKNQRGNKKIFVVNSNKELKVELRNISVGNRFEYILNALVAN